jgi:hypothetical protein
MSHFFSSSVFSLEGGDGQGEGDGAAAGRDGGGGGGGGGRGERHTPGQSQPQDPPAFQVGPVRPPHPEAGGGRLQTG